jgi:hypothetical protein
MFFECKIGGGYPEFKPKKKKILNSLVSCETGPLSKKILSFYNGASKIITHGLGIATH